MRSGKQNDSHPQRPNWESKKGEKAGKHWNLQEEGQRMMERMD